MKMLSLFNPLLRERHRQVGLFLGNPPICKEKTIWFHAASMGEFEQLKPVIEKLKSSFSPVTVIVSFFSPSGFNTQKNYPFADGIYYLPIDRHIDAEKFISSINPAVAVFSRYDLWRNHVLCCHKKGIAIFLVNATFTRSFLYSGIFSCFYKDLLTRITKIAAINETEQKKFRSFAEVTCEVIPDTRIDRIIERVETSGANLPFSRTSFQDRKILVIGSGWEQDFRLAYEALQSLSDKQRPAVVYVPHEPDTRHLNLLTSLDSDAVFLSALDKDTPHAGENVIVDSIGRLLAIYSTGDFALVGGGFGKGVHSVAEPAGYGLPIFSGPAIKGSPDATDLFESGALQVANNAVELAAGLSALSSDPVAYAKIGRLAYDYIYSKKGGSGKAASIINSLSKNPNHR